MNVIIDAATLRAMHGARDLVVVDCRFELLEPQAGRRKYAEGHIPGARYADLDEDLSGRRRPGEGRHPLPEPEALAETLRSLGISSTSRVVVYDDAGGAIAARLWWLLRWLGLEHAAVLDGGIDAWTGAGYELETATPEPARGDLAPRTIERGAVVGSDELEGLIAAGAVVLDARAPERFAGVREPIDAVAGHIPGARNLPFTQLLDAEGRFLPREKLRAVFETALGQCEASEAITMCGSGVTACHLLLGMAHAGLEGGRLYVDSWSGWITDPSRAVATE